jgi:hypothetical protein
MLIFIAVGVVLLMCLWPLKLLLMGVLLPAFLVTLRFLLLPKL